MDQDLIDEIYSVSVVERCEISDNAYRMYLQEDKVLQEAIKWVEKGEYPSREERKKMSSTGWFSRLSQRSFQLYCLYGRSRQLPSACG